MNQLNMFDIRQKSPQKSVNNIYEAIGFPRNPFRESEDIINRPLYDRHITEQLDKITQWLNEVYSGQIRHPLSLIGDIGTGKTRIIGEFVRKIKQLPPDNKVMVISVLSSDTGYTGISVGGLLIKGLENTTISGFENSQNMEVLPLIWAIVNGGTLDDNQESLLGRAIYRAQESQNSEDLASLISRWLRRSPLTPTQMKKAGFTRKIDWEGELIREIAGLIRIARQSGVIQTVYIFIDQLEELFGGAFSELRRARFLTDLRALIDEILEYKSPIGLLLAWSPQFATKKIINVGNQLAMAYGALYSRLQHHIVKIPLLRDSDLIPFAQTFIDALKDEDGFNQGLQPNIEDVVNEAVHGEIKASNIPRDFLGSLSQVIEKRAKKSVNI
jgi:Cdc6-like AAA superfamily ATPase